MVTTKIEVMFTDADGVENQGNHSEWSLEGSPAALYLLAHRVLEEIGLPHIIPATYADCVADVRVCPLCGESDCDNC